MPNYYFHPQFPYGNGYTTNEVSSIYLIPSIYELYHPVFAHRKPYHPEKTDGKPYRQVIGQSKVTAEEGNPWNIPGVLKPHEAYQLVMKAIANRTEY
ncbi:hypothetical protein QYM36_007852 [Artemia franciscana]|uniref:Uncharacterized protein n=1 Tax=Artemia franciscana TaxID=6661 RepID=A0AA88IHU4_ARTSF|nr:hypothetical protein QYM36_007852 [Artemia franciscana]